MFATDVCDGGRLQLERIIELKNRDGAELKGLFWNFTGEHHQMYLCLPPVDVCEFLPLNSSNNLTVRRERQAFNYFSKCREHHTGPLCSLCDNASYFKVNGHCEDCETPETVTATVFFAIGVVLCSCIFFKVILGWKGKSGKTLSHMLQASFMDYLQLSSILLDFPFSFPEPLISFLKAVAAVANFQVQGLGCATTMPHASLVPFQVFTAVLVSFFFLFFVAVEWLVVRCMLAGSANDNTDYSTLPKYIRWKEYNLSVGEYLCTFSVNFYLFALLSHQHLSFI